MRGLVAPTLPGRMGCLLFLVCGSGGGAFRGKLKDSIHILGEYVELKNGGV
jgi:hypothetical protein